MTRKDKEDCAEAIVSKIDFQMLPQICTGLGMSIRNAAADFELYCHPSTLRDVIKLALMDMMSDVPITS